MPPVIWIIDSQHWPRAYLRAELMERGFEAIGFIKLTHALAAFLHPAYAKPRLIVLELREFSLKPEELRILTDLRIPLIALGGAVELHAAWVAQVNWAAMLRRPFTIGNVVQLVEKVVGKPA